MATVRAAARRRRRHETRGAGEAHLLRREQREDHGAVRSGAGQRLAHALGREQHGHRARRVVVRAVVDGALVGPHRAGTAVAQVVVVGAHDHRLARPAARARAAIPATFAAVANVGRRATRPDTRTPETTRRARTEVAVHLALEPLAGRCRRRRATSPRPRGAPAGRGGRRGSRARRCAARAGGPPRPAAARSRTRPRPPRAPAPGGPCSASRTTGSAGGRRTASRRRAPAARSAAPGRPCPCRSIPYELPVADRRGLDAVSDEGQLARERAGAGHAERHPVVLGDALERVAVLESDARLHLEGLPVALAERRTQADRPQALLDPVGRTAEARGAEPAPLHLVRRQHGHVVGEPAGQIRPARLRRAAPASPAKASAATTHPGRSTRIVRL